MDNVRSAAAGWYSDPSGAYQLRWWNGERWSEHVHPAPHQAEAAQPYPDAQPAAQALAVRPDRPSVRRTAARWTGIALVVAGFARLSLAGNAGDPDMLGAILIAGVLEGVAFAGALAALASGGIPRTPIGRVLAWVLSGLYLVSGIGGTVWAVSAPAETAPTVMVVTAIVGLVIFGLGLTVGILTVRDTTLPPQLRRLPLVLYCALFASVFAGDLAMHLGAVAAITIGVLFIVFAKRVDAAAVAA